jgi:hypothetical protein
MLRPNPLLYQLPVLPWLRELSDAEERPLTLESVPASRWDELARHGCDLVWLMGVWQRSRTGRQILLSDPGRRALYDALLPGWRPEEVAGSPFSLSSYAPSPEVGGWGGLAAAREELNRRGIGLVLDFVANHTGPDHPWVREAPDFFFPGRPDQVLDDPAAFHHGHDDPAGILHLAKGRDPYFPPWADTCQLNYFNRRLRETVVAEARSVASRCDGLRCDMAMLELDHVFGRQWNSFYRHQEGWDPVFDFWNEVREAVPRSLLVAECYWETEWSLSEAGFDFLYDKRFYDRLLLGQPHDLLAHLRADPAFQGKLVRFLENHDEARCAETFGPDHLEAAAVLLFTLPGMKLLHHGQIQGRRLKAPPELARFPAEETDPRVEAIHRKLLALLADPIFHGGEWHLGRTTPAFDESHHSLVTYSWRKGDQIRLVAANPSGVQVQGRIPLEGACLGDPCFLEDLLSGEVFQRSGAEMADAGLHVLLPPFRAHVFRPVPS